MSRVRFYPYGPSEGLRALSDRLGVPILRKERSKYRPRAGDKVVNWGAASMPRQLVALRPLNHPGAVEVARNKLHAFQRMAEGETRTVEWTTNPTAANVWWAAGHTVVGRRTLTGHSGQGICIMEPHYAGPHLRNVMPLYTKYFPAKHEYRVHVIGDLTHVQKKRRRDGAVQSKIRNLANGYVYCTQGVTCPEPVLTVAETAVRSLGLDFGAVDILCTDRGDARVLEVNTAPGLEGSTLTFYADALRGLL